MAGVKKPYTGVWNIVRFNWHMFLAAFLIVLCAAYAIKYVSQPYAFFIWILSGWISLTALISLIVSFYIYDLSGLYKLEWLKGHISSNGYVANIHAGFDETSVLLIDKFPAINLTILDFYDPVKHTEESIRRARKVNPQLAETIKINTTDIQLADNSMDTILLILSAHEIRDDAERVLFFKEIKRVARPGAKIIVTEHMRDWRNFLAYSIGFLHFYSRKSWRNTFSNSGLFISQEISLTPFITTFICRK